MAMAVAAAWTPILQAAAPARHLFRPCAGAPRGQGSAAGSRYGPERRLAGVALASAAAAARVSALARRGRGSGGARRRSREQGDAPVEPPGRRQLLAPALLICAQPPSRATSAQEAPGGGGGRAPEVVRRLWGAGLTKETIGEWPDFFAEDCVYEDLYYAELFKGRSAVRDLLPSLMLPAGSRRVVDRVSDGKRSCGFTWHVEEDGVGVGQRGLTYVRLDESGRIAYLRELGEPLFKAGELTEKLLQALTKDQQPPPPAPTPAQLETPQTAGGIVKYLYGTVQASGGDAVRFFSEDVVYEDMNYEKPFVGKAAVDDFLARFQNITGVNFVLEEVSDGDVAVGFTYHIDIAGQPRSIKGMTFYEVDQAGKVCYVRDIPESATKPPPVQQLARALRPGLWRLGPSSALPGDIRGKDPRLQAA